MKKNIFLALLQAVIIFVIIGLMTYFVKGDFFYRYLSPIFAVAAGILRFFTASLLDTLKSKDKQ